MVADNDAGGISTYAVTGSKYGFSLLWLFFLLVPMAYFVQEMAVRLGAVTNAAKPRWLFEGFGPLHMNLLVSKYDNIALKKKKHLCRSACRGDGFIYWVRLKAPPAEVWMPRFVNVDSDHILAGPVITVSIPTPESVPSERALASLDT